MTEKLLRDWFLVGFHTHSRLGAHLADFAEQDRERLTHDVHMTIDAMAEYITKFTGGKALICDTDHAFHILDRYGVPRETSFTAENIDSSISLISDGVVERARFIRSQHKFSQIRTGVEADILNTTGKLDVTNTALEQLDVVIASLHWNWWNFANGRGPTTQEYLEGIENASKNPNVDAIGHPTRDIYSPQRESMKSSDWDKVLQTLIYSDVAFEINLYSYYAASEKLKLERDIIHRAAELGVKFVIGLDLHGLTEYGGVMPTSNLVTTENFESIFEENRNNKNFKLLLRMARVKKELESLGMNSDNILNSSQSKFETWLKKRHANRK